MTRADQLAEIGAVAGVAMDGETAHRVATWAYSSAQVAGGHAWLATSCYEQVDSD